jgi:hypothetical protein
MGASFLRSVRHAQDLTTCSHAVVRMAHAATGRELAPMGRSYR